MAAQLAGPPTALRPGIAEASFQRTIIDTARLFGWAVYWPPVNRPGVGGRVQDVTAGWPDLVLLHPPTGRALFRELKTAAGRIRPEQAVWLDALSRCGLDAELWRPGDWPEIVATLGAPPADDTGRASFLRSRARGDGRDDT